MQQFTHAFRPTSFALVPHPLPYPSSHVSMQHRDHQKTSGVTSKVKTALSYAPYPKTSTKGSENVPPSLTVSSAVTKNLITIKGIAPCGSTVGGASALTTPTMTALPPISNASRTHVLYQNGTLQWVMYAQPLLKKKIHMNCDVPLGITTMKDEATSCVVATGIGGA